MICRTVVGRKPDPFRVRVVAAEPTTREAGESDTMDGTGLFTPIELALEVPPPGLGLLTLNCSVCAVAKSAAVSAADNCVELTYVVARVLPFTESEIPGTKFVPVTWMLAAVDPSNTAAGDTPVMLGSGLSTDRAVVVGSAVTAMDPLATVTKSIWPVVSCPAVTLASTSVLLTYVVGSAVPFSETILDAVNPVPFTTNVIAGEPMGTLVGETVVIVRGVLVVLPPPVPAVVPPLDPFPPQPVSTIDAEREARAVRRRSVPKPTIVIAGSAEYRPQLHKATTKSPSSPDS